MERKCLDTSGPNAFNALKNLTDELQHQFTFEGMGIDPNGPPVRFDDPKHEVWETITMKIIKEMRMRLDSIESRVTTLTME
jgi:hypothetical protein